MEVGGADFDMWNTIGEGLNFNFRQEYTFNYFILIKDMLSTHFPKIILMFCILQPHTKH